MLPSIVIHRERLLTLLQESVTGSTSPDKQNRPPTKLVLLCAPAGYGKTTLLADFAQSSTLPCCWYILDRSDGEPATFLMHLLLSIRQRFPQFGLGLDALMRTLLAPDVVLPRDEAPFDLVIDTLAQAMAQDLSEPVTLLLCNYHEIHEQPSIKRLMDRLLSQLPTHWTIFLESRVLPNLSTTSLLSRREMIGIGAMALRFSARELQQLVQVLGFSELDQSEAEHVIQAFDGWIMGILLGTHLGNLHLLNPEARDLPILSMASQIMPRDVSPKLSLGEDQLQVFFSLVDQVFHREPRLRAFLAEAAILEEMPPAFCNRLLGIEHADEYLHSLEQQGLFVTRSTTLFQTSYTCHPLLRDLFRWRLANESPERFRWLHQRAAELFRIDQHYSHAILHALEAQQPNVAAEVILNIEKVFLLQGQGTTLAHWIDLLPASFTSKHPRLQLLRARIHLLLGELDQALPLLEAATHLVDSLTYKEQGEEDVVHAEIALLRSRALFQVGHYHQAQSLCQQVVERLSVEIEEFLAEAHHLLGVCANVQGNLIEGIAHLQKALQLWGRTRVMPQTAELHSVLASSYSLLGNVALADHHGSCASSYWEQLQDEWGRATHLVRLGMVTQRQGNLRVAKSLFQEALNHATSPLRFQRAEAYALVSLGELSFEEGQMEQALAQSEQGLVLARKVQDKHIMHAALCILALIYGRMKDVQTAWLLISEAEPVGSTLADTEHLLSTLTRGTIWLEQGEYQRAERYLYTSSVLATEKSLLRERIQANIRLAASQLQRYSKGLSHKLLCF